MATAVTRSLAKGRKVTAGGVLSGPGSNNTGLGLRGRAKQAGRSQRGDHLRDPEARSARSVREIPEYEMSRYPASIKRFSIVTTTA